MQQRALTSSFVRVHRACAERALRGTHSPHLLCGVLAKGDVAALGARRCSARWSADCHAYNLLMILGCLDDEVSLPKRRDVTHEVCGVLATIV